jgi:DNA modification methylase
MSIKIFVGDSLEILRKLEDDSIHCCVTSPPYWVALFTGAWIETDIEVH